MPRRRLLPLLLMLLAAALGAGVAQGGYATAQSSGLPDMRWVSPTWGFTVRWFSNEWTVTEDSSSGGGDVLSLNDTLGNWVSFRGAPEYGGDAEACLDAMLAEALATPGAADFRLALDAAGDPYVLRLPTQAYAVFSMRVPAADGEPGDFVAYVECQTLVPGEAVLQRAFTGSPDAFTQWYDDLVKTLEGVYLPASAWLADDPDFAWGGVAPLAGNERLNAGLIVDDADEPLLLVGLEAESGATRIVTFENLTGAPLRIAPNGVELTLTTFLGALPEETWPQTAARWEDGFSSGDGSRDLAPGERATALIDFAPGELSNLTCAEEPLLLLFYHQPAGESFEIAESRLPDDLADCLPWPPGPAVGPPVLQPASAPQPPATSGVSRTPLLTDFTGQLDDLGRIPLARLTVAPGQTFTELPGGPIALFVETGSVTVVLFGDTTIAVPAGEELSADDGTALAAQNDGEQAAVLLVLALQPTAAWDTLLADDPFQDFSGFSVEALFPEQSLQERQAPRQFTIEEMRLDPGVTFTPIAASGEPPRAAVRVESGAVEVRAPDGAGSAPHRLASGESASVPPGAVIATAEDGPATLLIAYVW